MKRLLSVVGSWLGWLVLGVLLIIFALVISELGRGPDPASQEPYPPPSRPLATSTIPPYPPPGTPRPVASPQAPTSTRPPDPPTRTPTLTFTPAPPTPTSEPLPTLDPKLETFLYTTTGEKYPEIYRVQGDPDSHMLGPAYRVDTPFLWGSRKYLSGLYPSPDGKWVAVAWSHGEGGTFVSILEVNNGVTLPLFGEKAKIDQRVIFLDWSPDGNSILVLGGIDNYDLEGGLWLVDVSTREIGDTTIRQTDLSFQEIIDASLSPDGKAVVYARRDHYQGASEVWRVALDTSDRQLLFKDSEFRVGDVLWSPDGHHIAFTRWRESTDFHDFAIGELWVMEADGSERRLLGTAVTGHYRKFVPVWSPDSQQIVFIQGSGSGGDLTGLSSNVYVVDVLNSTVKQLTDFKDTQTLVPNWSPDGSMVTFVTSQADSPEQFESWAVAADGSKLDPLDGRATLVLDSRKSYPVVVWLPPTLSEEGGQ